MKQFGDVLLELDAVDSIVNIALFDSKGNEAAVIQNKPGSSGSVKVYYHLYKMFGSINVEAALEGLSLFSEHTADAKANPGKHPNIDRLLQIVEDDKPYSVKVTEVKS